MENIEKIEKKQTPNLIDLDYFILNNKISLPEGFIDFYKVNDGAFIQTDINYTEIWTINEITNLNKEYEVSSYAPDFILFGSEGDDNAFGFSKLNSKIYNLPFIGLSNEEAVFYCSNFNDFIKLRSI